MASSHGSEAQRVRRRHGFLTCVLGCLWGHTLLVLVTAPRPVLLTNMLQPP